MSLFNSLKIEEKNEKNNPYHSLFIFHHLPRDMGTTLGNCLRRTLLSYISGIAVCGVEIADKNGPIKSKFTTLVGVDKVALYLISSLKEIVLEEKKPSKGIFCLELDLKNKEQKERIITAADFIADSKVEIKNPELVLATLAPQASLKIRLYCQKSLGYQTAEKQKKEYFAEQENIIALDSDYSPVKGQQVNFQVEPVIISLTEEEEKLTISIKTNGEIKPKNALHEALMIIGDLLNNINKSLK